MGIFVIDDRLVDSYSRNIGIHAYGVYSVLRRHSDKGGVSFPSVQLIADKMGISGRQVTRGIGVLEWWGIISVRRRVGQGSRYYLHSVEKWRSLPVGSLKDGGGGWRDGRPVEADIDLVWPESRVASAVFPDKSLTCEWGHSFASEFEGTCLDCALLRGEEVYKRHALSA